MAEAPTLPAEAEVRGQTVDISRGRESAIIPPEPKPPKKEPEGTAGDGETPSGTDDETGAPGASEPGNGEDKGDGDDINPATNKPYTAKEWREKFSASSRGAQELLDKNKTLISELEGVRATESELTKQLAELRKVAEGQNPEGLSLHDLQTSLEKTTRELALVKEEKLLDDFEKTAPLASGKREALRSLSRANPKETLQKLWDDHLKAGAEAAEAARVARETSQKKGQGEKGKGTSGREPQGDTIGGYPLAEFNKLPVAKRKQILQQVGQA